MQGLFFTSRSSAVRDACLGAASLGALGLALCASQQAFAQQGASQSLPAVVVSAPTSAAKPSAPLARAKSRARSSAVAGRSRRSDVASRVVPAPSARPSVNAPVVNSQDARAGVAGYTVQRITSATKTNTPLINTPQSVTVLPKQVLQDQAASSIGEAVRYVPGVIWHQGEGNRDDLVMRGQRSNADFYVNGIRDDVQYYRDFYNLQRLEVLKGPNAMIFGRGGGGGVVNRVLKEADGVTVREFTLGGNSYPGVRGQFDVGQAVSDDLAVRLNGFAEKSDSYRNFVELKRYGINPTLTYAPTAATSFKLSYEHFHDERSTDRGIPSQKRPFGLLPQFAFPTSPATFFGAPGQGDAVANVHSVTGAFDHDFGNGLTLRNVTQYASYGKFYQNVFPGGAVNVAGTAVALSAYNNQTDRQNLFNQTDLTWRFKTGPIAHTLLAGVEFGRQTGIAYRQTGFFNGNFATTQVAVSPFYPLYFGPMFFSNRPTDANSAYRLNLAAAYVQDQIEIGPHLQVVGGLRFDRFDLSSTDQRSLATINRIDNLVSPRVGVIVKPVENLSLYGSYSVSYLPSAGDQFSALTPGLALAKPEKFVNLEIGAKWDIHPRLQLTAALYNLDRYNQRIADPNNPGYFLLSGRTNAKGVEAGITGYVTDEWQVFGGYAYTDARIKSDTSATIVAGNRVGLAPLHTFSLWNRYQLNQMFGAGLGVVHQTNFFASSDNQAKLPGFTRLDGAIYLQINDTWRAQLNVENIFDRRYIATADGNNNLMPGSPRAARFSMTAKF